MPQLCPGEMLWRIVDCPLELGGLLSEATCALGMPSRIMADGKDNDFQPCGLQLSTSRSRRPPHTDILCHLGWLCHQPQKYVNRGVSLWESGLSRKRRWRFLFSLSRNITKIDMFAQPREGELASDNPLRRSESRANAGQDSSFPPSWGPVRIR